MPQRNQEKDSNGKRSLFQEEKITKERIEKMSQEKNGETLIWSVTLYCAETWTLREEDITRLEAFEIWICHRMEKIIWTEHISNEEVLKLVEEESSLLTIIRTRQRNWMGHIMRGDSLQRQIIKEEAQHRETWSHWRSGPTREQRT